jgi:hypothetical protein
VIPLLLVKRFAFDIELLAVSRRLGFGRIRELPVTLKYRFTGSGVGSAAVLRALVDTAAIFYRLSILRYYDRRRQALGENARRAFDYRPLVSLVAAGDVAERLDYEPLEVIPLQEDTGSARAAAALRAQGEVLAFLRPGDAPASNWLASTVPFLARSDVAAVVTPSLVPHTGSDRERAAGAIWESRLGGGSLYFRYTPGNLRPVTRFPLDRIVIRRQDFLALAETGVDEDALWRHLSASGKTALYTPETVVVASQPPLFRSHLRSVLAYGRSRGASVRRLGWRGLRVSTIGPLLLLPVLGAGLALIVAGGSWRTAGLAIWAIYGGSLVWGAVTAALRFRSGRVGLLTAAGLPLTHLTYAAAFVRGFRD